jgi:hypothetical protein
MHYLDPTLENAHICFFYKNIDGHCPSSHIGLGVNARHMTVMMRSQKVRTDTFGVNNAEQILKILQDIPTCTHAVIEAIWVNLLSMEYLMQRLPNIQFVVRCHSQVGFIQVEAGAVATMRELLHLQESTLNFRFAANSSVFCDWIKSSYHASCLYLPNLYDFSRVDTKHVTQPFNGKLVRIASFGALRLLKNHSTAAAAAQLIARSRNCDLEFYLNVNRVEHGKGILDCIRNMYKDLRWAKLIEVPWEDWPTFRRTVAHMDLCLQISFTETFNITTADATAELVPSVVSDCIEWLPDNWKASADNANEVAKVGNSLLWNPHAPQDGLTYLKKYVANSLIRWKEYITGVCTT